MKPMHLAPVIFLAALSACSSPDISRYAVKTPDVAATAKSRTTVEVREVSLPLYARDQEIPYSDQTGAIRTDRNALWADTPARAISLGLAESIAKQTGAVVAVEPWPLDESADVKLDVRVRTLLASADGSLRFSGQYFVVFESGRSPRSEWFDISIPSEGQSGQDIAAATGAAVSELAKMVSKQIR